MQRDRAGYGLLTYGHQHLTWRGTTVECNGTTIEIVPDDTYASMWRVRLPDGQLSGMLSARDAARAIALSQINNRATKKAA